MAHLTWIASYPRSGNTWLRFLIANCLADHEFDWTTAMNAFAFELYYYQKKMRDDGWSEAQVFETLNRVIAGQPTASVIGDRVFMKSHDLWSDEHPFSEHSRAAILLVRDPRDVLLSGLNYARLTRGYDGDDARYAREFIEQGGDPAWIKAGYGTWATHTSSWQAQGRFPVHVVKYEDLKSDPAPQLERICTFLGLPVIPELIATAGEKASIAKLRKNEVQAREKGQFGGLKDGYFFINKGQSGQSLDDLEPGLDDLFEQRFANELAELGYARSARS